VPLFLELAVSLVVVASCLQGVDMNKEMICLKRLLPMSCASIVELMDLVPIVRLKRCFFDSL